MRYSMSTIKFLSKVFLIAASLFVHGSIHAADTTQLNSSQVLSLLIEGNNHFITGKMRHLAYFEEAKDKLLESQMPVAVIVGCSDSRVPPELIFDRGLGELFVIRVAGNVVGPIEMDSVEFAVARLNVPLVVVLGHQNCGAVRAALMGREHVPELETIYPLIDSALKSCEHIGANTVVDAINCNVKKGVETLQKSPTIAPLLAQKRVKVVGAYFDFETGKVNLISN
jgi:carbonic anhydrase